MQAQISTATSQPRKSTNIPKKQVADTSFPYNPARLLDGLMERLKLKNDAALARALEVLPPIISKVRHRTRPISASLLIRMHEVSDLSIRDLRFLMGDERDKFTTPEL